MKQSGGNRKGSQTELLVEPQLFESKEVVTDDRGEITTIDSVQYNYEEYGIMIIRAYVTSASPSSANSSSSSSASASASICTDVRKVQ
jgi:hypothetical protein